MKRDVFQSTLLGSAILWVLGGGAHTDAAMLPHFGESTPIGRSAQSLRGFTTLTVTSCADDGSAGTLRSVIASAPDTYHVVIDMSTLTCSTITLETGEIEIEQQGLRIDGGHQTIDAAGRSRIFRHVGTQDLKLYHLTLQNGFIKYREGDENAYGGCITSNGFVYFSDTTFDNCRAESLYGFAAGGAVHADAIEGEGATVSNSLAYGADAVAGGLYAFRSLRLGHSTISNNTAEAIAVSGTAYGGGIYVQGDSQNQLFMDDVSVTSNMAEASQGFAMGGGFVSNGGFSSNFSSLSIMSNSAVSPASEGGGFVVRAPHIPGNRQYMYGALIAYNQAVNNGAGVVLQPTQGAVDSFWIVDSTISHNTATTGSSAFFAGAPIYLANSTVAFNQALGLSAGIYLYPGGDATIVSTILSNNRSSGYESSFDLVARASVGGNHDLIVSSSVALPADTIRLDPMLGPLANNGGATFTHALIAGSPAIDAGSLPNSGYNVIYDQRFYGFPRVVGAAPDIGAYERQATTDVVFGNGFDP